MNHTCQSSNATSVAQRTLADGTHTTELLTLSPSQSSEKRISSPSSSSRGSAMGTGMVVVAGVSGPKRSMDQVSSLSLEVNTMSRTTLGQRDDLRLRESAFQHAQTEMVVGMEVRDVDVREVLPHGDDLGDHPVGVAEELGGVDQNRVPLPVEQRGRAEESQIAVEKHPIVHGDPPRPTFANLRGRS